MSEYQREALARYMEENREHIAGQMARDVQETRARQDYADSHSAEWHAHQAALDRLGANAHCEPGCACEAEPW